MEEMQSNARNSVEECKARFNVDPDGVFLLGHSMGGFGAYTNVSRFTLWLHPEMVDFSKPIRITLNGKLHFDRRVSPSLATLLESFERRGDWGLVYPAKTTLDIAGEDEKDTLVPVAVVRGDAALHFYAVTAGTHGTHNTPVSELF